MTRFQYILSSVRSCGLTRDAISWSVSVCLLFIRPTSVCMSHVVSHQLIDQSKRIYIAPYVATEADLRTGRD